MADVTTEAAQTTPATLGGSDNSQGNKFQTAISAWRGMSFVWVVEASGILAAWVEMLRTEVLERTGTPRRTNPR